VRSAVFITPESLFCRPRATNTPDAQSGTPVFRLAHQAVRALRKLKDAGFMIIGIAGDELFHGFASRGSCREFLAAAELDDVIISHRGNAPDRCRGALIQAAGKWLLDLDRSFIIGKGDEIAAAGLTGCTPMRIRAAGERPVRDDSPAHSLGAAVNRILALDPPPTTSY
jgi:hypothetical protein